MENSAGQFAENVCDLVTAPAKMADALKNGNGKKFLGASLDVGAAIFTAIQPQTLIGQTIGTGVAGALDANGVDIPSKIKPIVMGEKDCLNAHFNGQARGQGEANTPTPQENVAPAAQSPLPKVGMGMLY